MKIIILALAFLALLALSSLARGLEITEMRFNAEYGDAYTYALEYTDRVKIVSGLK